MMVRTRPTIRPTRHGDARTFTHELHWHVKITHAGGGREGGRGGARRGLSIYVRVGVAINEWFLQKNITLLPGTVEVIPFRLVCCEVGTKLMRSANVNSPHSTTSVSEPDNSLRVRQETASQCA